MKILKDILSNIKNVSVGTWVRGILTVISLVNMALTALGKTPVSVEYDELYTTVSIIFAVIVGAVSYWKNNSFTSAAQEADRFLHGQLGEEEQ